VSSIDVNRSATSEYYDPAFIFILFGRQVFHGQRNMADWIHHVTLLPNHNITLGGEIESENFKVAAIDANVAETNVDNRAIFINDNFTWNDFFLNLGGRLDDHQSFGPQRTYKIAPGYNITQTGTRLKSSYGTGFKAPSLFQLYDPSTGNPNVQPEKSKGWDVGYEQTLWNGKVVFGNTYFRNDITNLIGLTSTFPFLSINTGKARTEGVESSLELHPTDQWTITATHTYTLNFNSITEADLLRRPKHQANVNVDYRYNDQWNFGGDVRYVSSKRDVNFDAPYNLLTVPSFTTIGLYTNYHYSPNITFYARGDNLLDKQYEEVYGYGQMGAAGFVGVKFSY
jgi:vitamin B12 transporter